MTLYERKVIQKLEKNREIDSNGCWLWTRTITKGYGEVYFHGKKWPAHRLAFFLYRTSEFNEYLQICHRCDIRSCFNPEHLFIGTQSDNMQDSLSKGRFWSQKVTHCPQGHEYTTENTYLDAGCRKCKECRKLRERRRNLYRR